MKQTFNLILTLTAMLTMAQTTWAQEAAVYDLVTEVPGKKHSESEMVKAVKELESGVSAEVVAREYGISKATLYQWKSKYSGMDVSQVRRLKELEEENRRLKQMYADLALDNRILKDVIEKKL